MPAFEGLSRIKPRSLWQSFFIIDKRFEISDQNLTGDITLIVEPGEIAAPFIDHAIWFTSNKNHLKGKKAVYSFIQPFEKIILLVVKILQTLIWSFSSFVFHRIKCKWRGRAVIKYICYGGNAVWFLDHSMIILVKLGKTMGSQVF